MMLQNQPRLRGLIGLTGGLVALGGLSAVYQTYATRRDERRFPAPGQLIDAGGFRLHLNVAG